MEHVKEPVYSVAKRFSALIRPDAPDGSPAQFADPGFAATVADYIGIQPDSQRMIKERGGEAALGDLLSEAFFIGQKEARRLAGLPLGSAASSQSAAADGEARTQRKPSEAGLLDDLIGYVRERGGVEGKLDVTRDFDTVLARLIKKHGGLAGNLDVIGSEFFRATGIQKSKHWFKRRAKVMKPDEDALDEAASIMAFEYTHALLREIGVDPEAVAKASRDASDALSKLDLPPDEERAIWMTRAMAVMHHEGQDASSLLSVLEYVSEHPESVTAVQILKDMVCLHEGLQTASDLIGRKDDTMRRAIHLFAGAFATNDLAYSMCCASVRYELVEAMDRAADAVLRESENDFPAMLVKSRTPKDSLSKIHYQASCIEALQHPCNSKYKPWIARMHEMRALSHGGEGNWQDALRDYRASIQAGGGRASRFGLAQCLQMLGQKKQAIDELQRYIEDAVQSDTYMLDEYQLPNAVYSKGLLHMHCGETQAAKLCCQHALVLEAKRCTFFPPVDTSAKRSLMRINAVFFGDASARAQALCEFQEAYRRSRSASSVSVSSEVPPSLGTLSRMPEWEAKLGDAQAAGSSDTSETHTIQVHLLEYSRHPQMLRKALLEGEPLRECRDALLAHGFTPELPSGAKVFVSPLHFEPVVRAVEDMTLKPYHVLATDSFYDLVTATVRGLPSRLQVREKSRSPISIAPGACLACGSTCAPIVCFQCHQASYCSRACQQLDWKQHQAHCKPTVPTVVKHTFFSVRVPSSLWSGPASSKQTATTADADPRKARNPRALAAKALRHPSAPLPSEAAIASSDSPPPLALGDLVQAHGLVSEAGTALNGLTGRIEGFSGQSGRWCVKFAGMSHSKQVKESNLRRCAPPTSIEALPEGGSLSVGATHEEAEASASQQDSLVARAELAVGDAVEAHSLLSEQGKEFNARIGGVIGHDVSSGRWCVRFGGRGIGQGDAREIKVKSCNLRQVQHTDRSRASVLARFLHYAMPFDCKNVETHGFYAVNQALTLFYVGCAAIVCETSEDAALLSLHLRRVASKKGQGRLTRDGVPQYVVMSARDTVPRMPFPQSKVNVLINFGCAPTLDEYFRRVVDIFTLSSSWPVSEPRGLVVNLLAAPLSPPYTELHSEICYGGSLGRRKEYNVSVFRVDHPESLHDQHANTFEKTRELQALEMAGVAFKTWGDEHNAGNNIDEWHLMLGDYGGKRRYWYNFEWSWTGCPPEPSPQSPQTISVNMLDLLNPFSEASRQLENSCMQGCVRIPAHLSVSDALELIQRRR